MGECHDKFGSDGVSSQVFRMMLGLVYELMKSHIAGGCM